MRNPNQSFTLIESELRQRPVSYPRRSLAPIRGAMTCLVLFKHAETKKALKVSDTGDVADGLWCAKSMLMIEPGSREGFIVASLPKFIADKNRLGPRWIDREGWPEAKVDALNEAEALAARKRNRLRNFNSSSLGHFGRNQFA